MSSIGELIIPDRIGELLIRKGETIAVAESVTAGHLQVAFSLAKDAMNFFQGGLTAYNLGQKARQLQVEPIHAINCNCVSDKVATQMALQVTRQFSSDWGIAVTGYASPVPEQGVKDLFAFYSLVYRGNEITSRKITVEKNSPGEVRTAYTNQILEEFLHVLES